MILTFFFHECKTSVNLTTVSIYHDLLSKDFCKTLMKQNFTEIDICLNTTKDDDAATLGNIFLKAVLDLLLQINLSSAQLKGSVKMCLTVSSLILIASNFSCIWL